MKKILVTLLLMVSLLAMSANVGEHRDFAGDEDYDPRVTMMGESVRYI